MSKEDTCCRIENAIRRHPEWSAYRIAQELKLSRGYVGVVIRAHPEYGYTVRTSMDRVSYTQEQYEALCLLVQEHPDYPRRKLAELTGIAPHTISNLVHRGMVPGYRVTQRDYHTPRPIHHRRRRRPTRSIAQIDAEAKQAGLSYGEYVRRMEEEDGKMDRTK